MIGRTDQANHQYDITRFWDAVNAPRMPAVSHLKAPRPVAKVRRSRGYVPSRAPAARCRSLTF
ncbi:MAG TPA: hypothetical protein VFO40_22470, partial [Chthoniobacterales bacterium]|nr:hypothetical protein [Chthoniobacterales bacterium]